MVATAVCAFKYIRIATCSVVRPCTVGAFDGRALSIMIFGVITLAVVALLRIQIVGMLCAVL